MAIRDRIKETVSKAAQKGARGAAKKPAGFGQALEDLLSFAGDLRGQATDRMQGELEKLAAKFDFVTRREFEAVRAIAIAARTQAEKLEAQLNGKKPKATASAAKKPAPVKKAPAKKAVAKKTTAAKKR